MDKKIIYGEVLKFGAGTNKKGFELLVSAVEKVIENPTIRTIELYDAVAEDFDDTRSRVERALRHYIECIVLDGDEDEVSKIKFTLSKTGLPTNTDFIKAFAVYLKLNFN